MKPRPQPKAGVGVADAERVTDADAVAEGDVETDAESEGEGEVLGVGKATLLKPGAMQQPSQAVSQLVHLQRVDDVQQDTRQKD